MLAIQMPSIYFLSNLRERNHRQFCQQVVAVRKSVLILATVMVLLLLLESICLGLFPSVPTISFVKIAKLGRGKT